MDAGHIILIFALILLLARSTAKRFNLRARLRKKWKWSGYKSYEERKDEES